MSKKHPTPWRLDFDDAYPEFTDAPIIDANGEPVVVTDSGVYPPDNETADEIVTAMNNQKLFIKERREHIATIDQLRDALARTRDALSRANKYGMDADAENGKLRDLVRRMANMAETTIPDAMENWDRFTSGRVEFEREAYALIREARAAQRREEA